MADKLCDISPEVREELKKFRFRKSTNNSALVLKIDREKQLVVLDEFFDDVSVEELQEQLPGHQPRYVILSYRMQHDDQRVSYPMCFIFYTPRDSQMELQMMYAGTKMALQREAELTRVYEVRELDDFTEEWLREKLK
ncbi:glia maturation factor beta [Lutzomyia longipalpis]|uniref:Putative glia maturation factor beta n=1 Tax=Lutzomyia longipalpis TaxID=7200 RepID=A0A1B0CNX4_LUTLO|nr:glia maturation factor beta [Lutzomyia longipalpis]